MTANGRVGGRCWSLQVVCRRYNFLRVANKIQAVELRFENVTISIWSQQRSLHALVGLQHPSDVQTPWAAAVAIAGIIGWSTGWNATIWPHRYRGQHPARSASLMLQHVSLGVQQKGAPQGWSGVDSGLWDLPCDSESRLRAMWLFGSEWTAYKETLQRRILEFDPRSHPPTSA